MLPPTPFPGLGQLGDAPDPRLASTEQTISSDDSIDPTQVSRIPLESLMQYHPELRALLAGSSPTTSLSSTADTSATSHSSNPTSSSHAPSSPTHHHTSTSRSALPITFNSALNTLQASSATLNSSSTGSLATSTTTSTAQHTAVPRTLESFSNPKQMLWHEHEARKADSRFGKKTITRDENGDIISDERYGEIETGIRLYTQEMIARIRAELEPEEKDIVLNFTTVKKQHIEELLALTRLLESTYPELSWCSLHYKAFRWILLRLKSETEEIAKKKRIEQKSQSKSEGKKRKVDDVQSASNRKAAAGKASVKGSSSRVEQSKKNEDEFQDAFDSDEEPRQPPPKKVKPLTPVQRLNALMRTSASTTESDKSSPHASRKDIFTLDRNSQNASASESNSVPKASEVARKDIQIPERASSAVLNANSASTVASSSASAPQRMFIPGRAPSSSNTNTSNNISAVSAKDRLSQMRSKDMSTRSASTADSLRMSLASSFSGLEERQSVLSAIDVLETAEGCGYGGDAEGDVGFVEWLKSLEQLNEQDITDEDELGEGFGHKTVGTWRYAEVLKTRDAWGTVQNGYKTIAALLRIWGLGREQLRANGNLTSQPIIHNHIGQVCERIETAFKITNARSSGQEDATNNEIPGEAEPSNKKPRARVSKELDQGIVSSTALKRLSKASAADFLSKAGIKFPKGAKKNDLIEMLVEAHDNNKVNITAEQVRKAQGKVDK
ncbi:hypothetical protein CF319_g908 [Tilletia indica]|nr:hypothetical protein CF319_g908 [Tilletia indica]